MDAQSAALLPSGTYQLAGIERETQAAWDPAELGQSGALVKCVYSEEGEIPLTYPVRQYQYRLPMIDLAGRQALACNQEIDSVYGSLIQASKSAMEQLNAPALERLSYTSFVHKEILTLRIDRQDYDGTFSQAYYTVHAETGEAVPVQELLSAVGLSGEPEEVLNQRLTELFVRRFGPIEDADLAYTTALNQTQSELLDIGTNRMHLTELGQLSISLTLYQPNGGSMREELLLP